MIKRALVVLGMAAAGSQAGHLVAYQLRFGALAADMQSTGAHVYFPALARTGLGLAAIALIAALLLIGASRVVRLEPGMRRAGGPSYLSLLAWLFTLQLALFMTQETVEAAVAGPRLDSTVDSLLWGMVGQLPVALAGAAALRGMWSRVEVAAETLIEVIRVPALAPVTPSVLAVRIGYSDQALLRSHGARSRIDKRGPPAASF
jgi:hypothetical protein